MHNSFGDSFRIGIYGGSHEPEVGVGIDGVVSGMPLCADDFQPDLARRRSGAGGTTARREDDIPEIICGVTDGLTDGSPLRIKFRNKDIRPEDYALFASVPRPGHTDFVAHPGRYGVEQSGNLRGLPDFTGGGIFSGRMTVALVAAGVVEKKQLRLKYPGVVTSAEIVRLGGSDFRNEWKSLLDSALRDGDSLGAVVECRTEGLPVGLGEPFFDSVESLVSHIVFAIPGVRGVEFGDGFAASDMRGSEHNDPFGKGGKLLKNGAGGVNGGLTNGNELLFRVAFKPTSTIRRPQPTWDFKAEKMTELSAGGRHDCCFALRTPVIVEAVTSIVLANLVR